MKDVFLPVPDDGVDEVSVKIRVRNTVMTGSTGDGIKEVILFFIAYFNWNP